MATSSQAMIICPFLVDAALGISGLPTLLYAATLTVSSPIPCSHFSSLCSLLTANFSKGSSCSSSSHSFYSVLVLLPRLPLPSFFPLSFWRESKYPWLSWNSLQTRLILNTEINLPLLGLKECATHHTQLGDVTIVTARLGPLLST